MMFTSSPGTKKPPTARTESTDTLTACCSGSFNRARKLICVDAGSTNMSLTITVFCGMSNSATFFWISSVVVIAVVGLNSCGIFEEPIDPSATAVSGCPARCQPWREDVNPFGVVVRSVLDTLDIVEQQGSDHADGVALSRISVLRELLRPLFLAQRAT
jgi:hypothetical protein